MKNKILYILTVITILLTSCNSDKNKDAKKTTKEDTSETVKVMKLENQKVKQTVNYSGTLVAFEERNIAPASPGKIQYIAVEIGDKVSKGKLLIKMDDTQLQQSKVQMNTLSEDLKRLEKLKETNSIAPQQYDQLKSQYDVAKTNVSFLETNTHITAPFSGVVSAKYYESGEIYSGAPNPMTGKAGIITLLQTNKLKINISISETYYPYIKNGMKAKVTTDLYKNQEFEAEVFNIYPTIDPTTRTFSVELVLNNRDQKLKPGMFVNTEIFINEIESILIPDYAVLKMQGSNERYLFVNNNGTAKQVFVKIGNRYDDKIEVTSDKLKEGDEIVVSGQSRLINGDKLKIVQ